MSKQITDSRYRYAEVDENPADVFGTEPFKPFEHMIPEGTFFFSVRDGGGGTAFTATITVQFKADGDPDWTEYETHNSVVRKTIEGGAGVYWRAVVKNGNYTAGVVRFGFDW